MTQVLTAAQTACLQRGLLARRQGRLHEAAAAFNQVLAENPDQSDALHLLGELEQAQGHLSNAELLLTRAARGQPRQLVIWARLASIQEALGRPADAEASLRQLLTLQSDPAEAHYNRARLLRALRRGGEARRVVEQALLSPHCTPPLRTLALQLLALLQSEAGALDEALDTLDAALRVAPQRAALHHNRAVLLQRQGRHVEALDAHQQALALGLDAADAHYNLGNTLQSLGRTTEALEAYRSALQREPQHELALLDTARLRWRLGHSDFAKELDAAIAHAPRSPVAAGIKGRLLLRAERYAEAAVSFTLAGERAPSTWTYADGLGQALLRQGLPNEALVAHRRAVSLAPADSGARLNLALALLYVEGAEAAHPEALEAVRLSPRDQHAWATLGLVWRALGDPREGWLNDYQRHVQTFDLVPPPGSADVASFNEALAALLERLHVDSVEPIDQTLRRGSQTLGRLFDHPEPLIRQLRSMVGEAVDRYVASLLAGPNDIHHPLRSRASASWHFTDSWSSRLHDGGFHTRHVHPHGWVSSCYYVALPQGVGTGSDNDPTQRHAGWIEFGAPGIAAPPGVDFSVRHRVQPAVGRLVLFPSFMWHGTVPFRGTDRRLTVAFDAVPDEATMSAIRQG